MTTTHKPSATLSILVNERIALKNQLNEITERLASMDAVIINSMREQDITKVETEKGKVTLIQSETIIWNDEVLKEMLTTAQWKRVIVEKVDKARLDAEILVGRINGDEVAVARSVKQAKPYLR